MELPRFGRRSAGATRNTHSTVGSADPIGAAEREPRVAPGLTHGYSLQIRATNR
jgi:hypothetical protein